MPKTRLRTGRHYPLGATWDGRGVNFALFSSAAQKVELCLFDRVDGTETRRIELEHHLHNVWYGYLLDARPGDLYAFRVHGPYNPGDGLRCNPHKLLLDPYARSIVGDVQWSNAHYGYVVGDEEADLSFSEEDDAALMPKCRVVDDAFDWGADASPHRPWHESVIYEVHVKNFTARHPGVPEALRGTYAGLAHPAALEHLKSLGVTAVELLPVHAFLDDQRLAEAGMRNHWGYNTIGFFAPEQRYAREDAVREFKQMVKDLHAAGLEVILDVVYNHTAEGNELGPTLSFKGIDHRAYYRLKPDDRRYGMDTTGCGNSLNTRSPAVIRMIMDSLRYWVTQMHVDGFRFDLAVALARDHGPFDPHAGLFAAIAQDPVLSQVKMIAEPWDLGEGGYQIGGFPAGWAEWNGAYRDTVRSFWCGAEGHFAELSRRLCGSSDLFGAPGRRPTDSINLVTVHDGFTLNDLVSFNHKHNESNGEDNRDGESHNRSWNCGAEGATDDPLVGVMRERQKRNLLATLLLSLGTPLLLGGDEMGRTQQGNNNAYCQDSEISWFDWTLGDDDRRLLEFTQALLAFRRDQPVLRRVNFLSGEVDDDGHKDVTWLRPDGEEMTTEDWQQPALREVAAMFCGWKTGQFTEGDKPLVGDSLLLLINGQPDPVDFALPALQGAQWTPRFDTRTPTGRPATEGQPAQGRYVLAARAIAVLVQPARLPARPDAAAAAAQAKEAIEVARSGSEGSELAAPAPGETTTAGDPS